MDAGLNALREALREIVAGRNVKRARHDLHWEGGDISPLFREILVEEGFEPSTVADLHVEPGERIPAFHIEKGVAFFGWVFREKFTEQRQRKLFGSVVRNGKGDWMIQISARNETVVFADPRMTSTMDTDNPGMV